MKWKAIILVVILFCSHFATAQKKDTASKVNSFSIKINPLQLALGEVRLLSEKYFNQNNSVELITSYLFTPSINIHNISTNGFKVGFGYRYYSEKRKSGPYLNPIFFYKYFAYKNASIGSIDVFEGFLTGDLDNGNTYDCIQQTYAFQLQIGQIYNVKHFVIDIFGGFGLRYNYYNITKIGRASCRERV